tara:strand:- start:952 stop:1194 length:243 start_codon:yes stop_codon:yes gene_type:complete
MPCSHCQGIGHNKRTCPEFKKTILQKPNILSITKIIQQQNTEYEEGLKQDLQKQKESQLAEPSIEDLRKLRLQFYQKGIR